MRDTHRPDRTGAVCLVDSASRLQRRIAWYQFTGQMPVLLHLPVAPRNPRAVARQLSRSYAQRSSRSWSARRWLISPA